MDVTLTRSDERRALMGAYRADHALFERRAAERAGAGWLALRLDGRSFHTLTKDLAKPFDPVFEAAMDAAAEALMRQISGAVLCYCQSDELTLVLAPEADLFDRRAEKLVSVGAATAASAFSLAFGAPGVFDGRLLELGEDPEAVMAMLAERQQDAIKNAAGALAYWTLRGKGLSEARATRRLARLSLRDRLGLLEELGAPFNALAPERRRGRLLTYERIERTGFDPIRGVQVTTHRRALAWDRDMPDMREHPQIPGRVPPGPEG